MDETARRPGGLTALAVFNFIFGGLAAVLLIPLAMLTFTPKEKLIEMSEPSKREELTQQLNDPNFMMVTQIVTAVTALTAFLYIASGVGYMKQKRWGRVLGNVGALIGVGLAVWAMVRGDADISTLIFAIYPALTLLLLNTTFKDDFRA